jgi:HEAT repeat protein
VELRDLLTGGDRRSIARADEALQIARIDREAVDELARLAVDEDALVSSRALDVLEKLVHEVPEWIEPHRSVFLAKLDSPFWEARLQCVRAIPLLEWNAEERPKVIDALRRHIDDEQKFVRCWALDAFAMVANDPSHASELSERLSEFLGSGVPSMQARARAVVKRLARP